MIQVKVSLARGLHPAVGIFTPSFDYISITVMLWDKIMDHIQNILLLLIFSRDLNQTKSSIKRKNIKWINSIKKFYALLIVELISTPNQEHVLEWWHNMGALNI